MCCRFLNLQPTGHNAPHAKTSVRQWPASTLHKVLLLIVLFLAVVVDAVDDERLVALATETRGWRKRGKVVRGEGVQQLLLAAGYTAIP